MRVLSVSALGLSVWLLVGDAFGMTGGFRAGASVEDRGLRAIRVSEWIEGSVVKITEQPQEIVFMRSERAETFPVAEHVTVLGPNGQPLPSLPVPSWCRVLLDRGKVVQINVIRVNR